MAQGRYKPTGDPIVDMVAACIHHYEVQKRPIEYIRLIPKAYDQLCAFVKSKIPGYDFEDGHVDFDGVKITKGSSLQMKTMYWEFKSPLILN